MWKKDTGELVLIFGCSMAGRVLKTLDGDQGVAISDSASIPDFGSAFVQNRLDDQS